MKEYTFEDKLIPNNIDIISEGVASFLKDRKVDKREIIRIRLQVEEILLNWENEFSDDTTVFVSCLSRFGKYFVQLQCNGESCNPLEEKKDGLGAWVNNLKKNQQFTVSYSYDEARENNLVVFSMPKTHSRMLPRILISLLCAFIVGFIGKNYLSYDIREELSQNVIEPVYSTYLNILGFCGIPLIFLSMVVGIVGVGDIGTFTRIGRRMIRKLFIMLSLATAVAIAIALPFFRFEFGTGALDISYKNFLDMILGWAPTNFFSPFIESNAMQLIIMGALLGISILVLDITRGSVMKLVNEFNSLMLLFAIWLTKLIPVFVFVTVTKSIWMSEMDVILPAWKSWVITTGLQLATILVMALLICVKNKVNIVVLLRKVSKTFVIALGTNSCSASIPENYFCCEKQLGIDPRIFVFGIPIGTSTFKPATAIRLVLLSLFMANSENVTISPGWIVMLFVISMMLSIAIPAIPGGTLMFCSMQFLQLGIPTEVIAQMLATDVFFDSVCTAFNQISVQLALTDYAGDMKYLDKEVLRQKVGAKV